MADEGLSGRLQQALRDAGMTEMDLAQRDMTPVYIRMIANGQIRPSLEVLQALADRLGKPVSYFLEGLPGSRADVLLLLNLATGYLEQEDTARARPLLEQAERYAQGQRDRRADGLVQMQLCRLCHLEGDMECASRCGLKALKLLQHHGEPEEIAQAMMYLGNVAWIQRNLYEALARYQDALVVLRNSGDERLLSQLRYNLGNTLLLLEEWEQAHHHLRHALELAAEGPDGQHQAKLQMNLALTYREQGELDRALELSVKALAALDENRKPYMVADIYNHMGSIYALRSDRHKARECFQLSLATLPDRATRQTVEAQCELARLDLEEGNVSSACERAGTALRCAGEVGDRAERGRCALLYAQALIATGERQEAVSHLETARAVFEDLGMRQSLTVTEDLLQHVREP